MVSVRYDHNGKKKLSVEEKSVVRQQILEKHTSCGMMWTSTVQDCPTYEPSPEEFQDPLAYIRKIQPEASKYGICKIKPPVLPSIPATAVLAHETKLRFTTRVQPLRHSNWDEDDQLTFIQGSRSYTIQEYEKMANAFFFKRFSTLAAMPLSFIETQFWKELEKEKTTRVEYGSDVEGTAFSSASSDLLARSNWNLQALPHLDSSILRLLPSDIPGVTQPMLYIGMLFAMFAWHVEDHYLYSINFHHCGAHKTWYGVPGGEAHRFEEVVSTAVYDHEMLANEGQTHGFSLLLGKTTMFSPGLLQLHNVPVFRAHQAPGEFVVTFPRSYHAGFSHGFNCGEAVNFAVPDWLPFGADACLRYSLLARLPLLPHEQLLAQEALLLAPSQLLHGSPVSRPPGGRSISSSRSPQDENMVLHIQIAFVRLLRQNHLARWLLAQAGAREMEMPKFWSSMPCSICYHLCQLAMIVCNCSDGPTCLNHSDRNHDCTCGLTRYVLVSPILPWLVSLARTFEHIPDVLLELQHENYQDSLDHSGYTPWAHIASSMSNQAGQLLLLPPNASEWRLDDECHSSQGQEVVDLPAHSPIAGQVDFPTSCRPEIQCTEPMETPLEAVLPLASPEASLPASSVPASASPLRVGLESTSEIELLLEDYSKPVVKVQEPLVDARYQVDDGSPGSEQELVAFNICKTKAVDEPEISNSISIVAVKRKRSKVGRHPRGNFSSTLITTNSSLSLEPVSKQELMETGSSSSLRARFAGSNATVAKAQDDEPEGPNAKLQKSSRNQLADSRFRPDKKRCKFKASGVRRQMAKTKVKGEICEHHVLAIHANKGSVGKRLEAPPSSSLLQGATLDYLKLPGKFQSGGDARAKIHAGRETSTRSISSDSVLVMSNHCNTESSSWKSSQSEGLRLIAEVSSFSDVNPGGERETPKCGGTLRKEMSLL